MYFVKYLEMLLCSRMYCFFIILLNCNKMNYLLKYINNFYVRTYFDYLIVLRLFVDSKERCKVYVVAKCDGISAISIHFF